MAPQAIPEGLGQPIPSLSIDGAAEAIEFYKRAFGAQEQARMEAPGGMIAYAMLTIGSGVIMLADAFPQSAVRPPSEIGGTSVSMMIYVDDVDAVVEQAVAAGGTITMPVEDQFWGDRYGRVKDPFGHEWEIATHVEDVDPEEMARRGQEAMAGMG